MLDTWRGETTWACKINFWQSASLLYLPLLNKAPSPPALTSAFAVISANSLPKFSIFLRNQEFYLRFGCGFTGAPISGRQDDFIGRSEITPSGG
jgi:hypothetical protein